jgi:Na+/H+ antiporter NhaD/arsenite permease-like protein
MHQLSGHSPFVLAALITIFVIAYAATALEHPLKINKSGSALVGAGLLWTIYALGGQSPIWRSNNWANR